MLGLWRWRNSGFHILLFPQFCIADEDSVGGEERGNKTGGPATPLSLAKIYTDKVENGATDESTVCGSLPLPC